MSKITVTVPEGDCCVAAGIECKFVDRMRCYESEYIKAYPRCIVYGNALDLLINKEGYSVAKCDRCLAESGRQE
jgi:hypothetical protein